MKRSAILRLLSTAIAFVIASAAHAQTGALAVVSDTQAGASQPPASAPVDPTEIVVTAQKTSQTVQRVPAAVSVVGNEQLTRLGITNLTQISNVAPGVNITPVRTQAFVFVRGVGQALTSPNADPSVATNLNGVYLPAEIAGTAFFDVDRVEVLPGPQGTLYGRNSTGGAINIISRTPRNRSGADGFVEIGNYGRVQAVAGVDLVLSDTLGSRTAGTIVRHDGYFNNGEDDQDTLAARETLAWRPTDRTRVTGVATYTRDRSVGSVLQNIPFQECGVRCATFDPDALGYRNKSDVLELSLNAEHEVARGVTVAYTAGYNSLDLDVRNTIFTGPPIAPLLLQERITSQSHEGRINAKLDRVEAILGGYYFRQTADYYQDARPSPAQHLINPFTGVSSGYAGFGQATYSILPALRVTGGLRVSHTTKSIDGFNSTFNALGSRVLLRPYVGQSSLNRLDWKVGTEFDVNPRSLLYASVSTGFTPGGFSTAPAVVGQVQAATFKPVYLTAYTAGSKNRLFGGALTLNAEGFYYDYRNYQVSARDLLTAQNLVFTAEKATIYGAQIDTRAKLGRHDELTVSATYLHAKADILRTPTGRFDGFDLPYAPRWSANAFYQHGFDVSHDAQVRASANIKYSSSRWALYTHAPGFNIDANTHTDLNFGYFAASDRWSLQAFVRNLEDSVVKTACGNAIPGQAGCFFEPPRTYGATLGFRY